MKTVNKVQGRFSYTISDENKDGDKFNIPVVDVRDGAKARETVKAMENGHRQYSGSKFFGISYSGIGKRYN